MAFNSIQFIVFCLIIIPAYFVLPHRFKPALLLLASVFFYLIFPPSFILTLGAIICFDVIAGFLLEQLEGGWRKVVLVTGILANIGLLLGFKYFNFINENVGYLLSPLNIHLSLPYLTLLVPVGLSYITFQSISYKAEVYRNNIPAERNPGIYALYILYFPKVMAGPIERPQHLIPQFRERHEFDFVLFKAGIMQMTFGFFKKVVIADRIALVVDPVFKNLDGQNGMELVIAVILYSFQIFCDFSGYTDIALGVSKVMGFRLTDNFDRPYFSKSIAEFWRRWHITLSSWLRDYIFLPLAYGLSRRWPKERYLFVKTEKWIYFAATFVTFLICGLWHGAAWHFVFWGGLYAVYLSFSQATSRDRKAIYKMIKINKFPLIFSFTKILTTFLLVSFAWILFRADSLEDAFYIYYKITTASFSDPVHFSLNGAEMAFTGLMIIFLLVKEWFFFNIDTGNTMKWGLLLAASIFFIYFFGVFNMVQFIYFQF